MVRKDRSGREGGERGARQGGRVSILHGMGQVNHSEKVLSEQTEEASDGVTHAGVWGRSVSGRGNTQECAWCAWGITKCKGNAVMDTSCPTIFCDSFWKKLLFPWAFVSSMAGQGRKMSGYKKTWNCTYRGTFLVKWQTRGLSFLLLCLRLSSMADGESTVYSFIAGWETRLTQRWEWSPRTTPLSPQNTALKVTSARHHTPQRQRFPLRAWRCSMIPCSLEHIKLYITPRFTIAWQDINRFVCLWSEIT